MDQHDRGVLTKAPHCDAGWSLRRDTPFAARRSFIAAAISTTCVSVAKCPISRNSIRAFGMSFRDASAPAGTKKASLLPKSLATAPRRSESNPETPKAASRPTRNRETNPAECLCSPDAPAEPCPARTIQAEHSPDPRRACTAIAFLSVSECYCGLPRDVCGRHIDRSVSQKQPGQFCRD